MQFPVVGSFMQTVNLPLEVGNPSAPGYVPKYESNERFSCMMITMCLIFSRAWARDSETGGVGDAA